MDTQYFIVTILLCLGIILLIQSINTYRFRNKLSLPPSPTALPIIGHIHLLGPIAHQALHKLSTHYGPLMYLFIGSIPNVIVSSTEMANEILKSNELNFLNRPTMQNVDYLTYGSADFFSAPYGLHWKFMKRICMMELFSSRAIDRFANVRTEELRKLLVRVMKKAEIEESVDLGEQLKELTSSIITRMMFRERRSDSGRREEVIKMVVELNELAGFFNVSETFWFLRRLDLQGIKKRLKNARERYDVIIERIMKEHESRNHKDAGGVRSMLDILLDIYEDKNSEIKLTRENIKGFIMVTCLIKSNIQHSFFFFFF